MSEETKGLKDALEYIVDVGIMSSAPKVVEIKGKTYCRERLIEYGGEPQAAPLTFHSLTAMVEYIKNCPEEYGDKKMILHVTDPEHVGFYTQLDMERRRERLADAVAITPDIRYNSPYSQEAFITMLQSRFLDTEDKTAILQFTANVVRENSSEYIDDGISQTAVVRTGVAKKELAYVPSPASLRPYRTFLEVRQPASDFIFRMETKDKEPSFKLIEADGGMWRTAAMESIAEYLKNELAVEFGGKIVILA